MCEVQAAPEWVKPGAQVVLFTEHSRNGNEYPARATIKSVGKVWFTVDSNREPRFKIATQRAASSRDVWTQAQRRAVPLDSGEARAVLVRARDRRLAHAAETAALEWAGDKSNTEALHSAISALGALLEFRARQ